MIQSLFILKDRGLRITLGKIPRDDTIPLQHHYSPFRGRSFLTTPILSRKCSNSTRGRGFISTSSSKPSSSTSSVLNTELSPSVSPVCEYRKHHHLYLQYRNTESPSSVSTVCKYWNIIYIFSMGILKSSLFISSVWEYWNHHHLYLSVWKYWNIIISIFSIEILNHHHLHLQYHQLHLILYVEIPDFYVLRRNTGFFVITTMFIT